MREARAELNRLAEAAGRDPSSITISVYGQVPDKDIVQPLLDAGADRVVIRPVHVETEKEMGAQLEKIASDLIR